MNLLIIIKGNEPELPDSELLFKANKILLLYLSPRVKAIQYKEKLHSIMKNDIEIQIINPKKIVDFYYIRKTLLDFIADLPEQLIIGDSTLSEYLNIEGLNMWWSSGIVEATPYKQNILQNFYYLSAVKYTSEKSSIDLAWFQVDDAALAKDLSLMFDRKGTNYFQEDRINRHTGTIYKIKQWRILKHARDFIIFLTYWIIFKIICPKFIIPKRFENQKKDIHLFYSNYPCDWFIKNSAPKHKIFRNLPLVLTKILNGKAYFLSEIELNKIYHPFRLIREIKGLWRNNIRFIPMVIYISFWEMLKIFSPFKKNKKYNGLIMNSEYRKCFKLNGIDMFHTFDKTMRNSLFGFYAWNNFFHYYAFQGFINKYGKNIFQIIYSVEFHSWEVALISGARNGDDTIPIVGLQQSAPNPILLSFFFSPATFDGKSDKYPLPDLLLCSADIHKDLMQANGIDPKQVEVVGFIGGHYLKQAPISEELKLMEKQKLGIAQNKQFCLVICSIDLSLTEGIIYLLKETVSQLPKVFFAIKGHPDTSIEQLLYKYGMNTEKNVKLVDQSISTLMPLTDYFLSISTSVSIEALCADLPQVNLDVGGLPMANPLHMVPGLIEDVETPDDLLEFFHNTEKFHIPKEKSYLFMDNTRTDPCQNILDILVTRFYRGHTRSQY